MQRILLLALLLLGLYTPAQAAVPTNAEIAACDMQSLAANPVGGKPMTLQKARRLPVGMTYVVPVGRYNTFHVLQQGENPWVACRIVLTKQAATAVAAAAAAPVSVIAPATVASEPTIIATPAQSAGWLTTGHLYAVAILLLSIALLLLAGALILSLSRGRRTVIIDNSNNCHKCAVSEQTAPAGPPKTGDVLNYVVHRDVIPRHEQQLAVPCLVVDVRPKSGSHDSQIWAVPAWFLNEQSRPNLPSGVHPLVVATWVAGELKPSVTSLTEQFVKGRTDPEGRVGAYVADWLSRHNIRTSWLNLPPANSGRPILIPAFELKAE